MIDDLGKPRLDDSAADLWRGERAFAGGFSVAEASLLFSQTTRFILGLVLLEVEGGPGACRDDSLLAAARSRLEALPAGRYAHLAEATPHLFGACDQDAAFDKALDLLVAGVESRLPRPRQ